MVLFLSVRACYYWQLSHARTRTHARSHKAGAIIIIGGCREIVKYQSNVKDFFGHLSEQW